MAAACRGGLRALLVLGYRVTGWPAASQGWPPCGHDRARQPDSPGQGQEFDTIGNRWVMGLTLESLPVTRPADGPWLLSQGGVACCQP